MSSVLCVVAIWDVIIPTHLAIISIPLPRYIPIPKTPPPPPPQSMLLKTWKPLFFHLDCREGDLAVFRTQEDLRKGPPFA
jgi:hypothetical protein